MNKIKIFEYLIWKFLEEYSIATWNKKEDVFLWKNDLSILKIQKLLFFVSTKSNKLLSNFSFHALPYWPVDIDTYKKYVELETLDVSTKNTKKISDIELDDEELKLDIDNSINNLKLENPSIFKLWAFDLVHISHKWSCWKDNKDFRGMISHEDILFSITYYK